MQVPVRLEIILMLKSGVAVHYAGLIPVWREFMETLLNAKKIKVLFATETLATVCTCLRRVIGDLHWGLGEGASIDFWKCTSIVEVQDGDLISPAS